MSGRGQFATGNLPIINGLLLPQERTYAPKKLGFRINSSREEYDHANEL
jgi:hypothetical protein